MLLLSSGYKTKNFTLSVKAVYTSARLEYLNTYVCSVTFRMATVQPVLLVRFPSLPDWGMPDVERGSYCRG
jgi:hypothetical protein